MSPSQIKTSERRCDVALDRATLAGPSVSAPPEPAGPSGSLRCAGVVGATLDQRKEWHPAATTKEEATRRFKTLIYRLRSRGDDYNADIAEMEILPFVSGPNGGCGEFVRQFAASMVDDLQYWQAEVERYPRASHGRRAAAAHANQLSRLLSKIPKAYLPNIGSQTRPPKTNQL